MKDAGNVCSVEEAARVLGIGRGLAYDLARRGGIPALRLGRRLVVSKAALQRMLDHPEEFGEREEAEQ